MWHKVLCLVIIVGLLGGCATDSGRTKAEGTGVGAGLGAALGAGLGYLTGGPEGALKGAAAGAVVGGVAGYAWGAHVASQKAKYARTEDYLDAVLQQGQTMNAKTQQYNVSLAQHIRQLDRDTATLVQQYQRKQIQKTVLQAKYQESEQKLTEARQQLAAVNTEIQIQQRVLNNEKQEVQSVQGQTRLSALATEIQRLEQQRNTLGQQTSILEKLKTRVQVS